MTATGWSALISLAVAIVVLGVSLVQWWDIGFDGDMRTRWWVKRLFVVLIALLLVAAVLLIVGEAHRAHSPAVRVRSAGTPIQGWWARNAPAIQVASTVALVVVTAFYVALTRRIAAAATRQASAANAQVVLLREQLEHARGASDAELAHLREALDAERVIASDAQLNSERLVIEATRARLSAITPPCIVLCTGSVMNQVGNARGPLEMEAVDTTVMRVIMLFEVRNDGDSAVLLESVRVDLGGMGNGHQANWLDGDGAPGVVVLAHTAVDRRFQVMADGALMRQLEGGRAIFEFTTTSPISGVTDRHHWVGTFPMIHADARSPRHFDRNGNRGWVGPPSASMKREWPGGLGQL